jgi:hypothetical protein
MRGKMKKGVKRLLIGIGIFFVVFMIIGAIASGSGSDETTQKEEPAIVQSAVEELAPVQEPETTIPPQSELLAYIEKEMYILDDNGFFNTIVIRPFEFEITEYKINNKNRISSIAVRVYYADMSDGKNSELITGTAVQIVINWLVEHGYDPFEEWIGITCRGYF